MDEVVECLNGMNGKVNRSEFFLVDLGYLKSKYRKNGLMILCDLESKVILKIHTLI
tara:strand:+ start:209 stop:376 length:168 start_codon:yes stop_codon:yes gene_type:complete